MIVIKCSNISFWRSCGTYYGSTDNKQFTHFLIFLVGMEAPIIIGAPRRDCITFPLVVEHSYGSHGPYSSTIYLLTSESFRCNVEITRGVAICCNWKIIFRSWWLFAG